LLKANIERIRSPEKQPSENVALHTFPWAGRSERVSWKPANPEHALSLNFWWSNNLIYLNKARVIALLLLSSILAMIGLALIITGRVYANSEGNRLPNKGFRATFWGSASSSSALGQPRSDPH
jgi:hypothetical protein